MRTSAAGWTLLEEAADRYQACLFDPYEFFLDLLRSRGEESWNLEDIRGLWRAFKGREPVGLYIEIPFCRARCAYCSFYSVVPSSRSLVDAYLDRLEREMDLLAPALRGRRLASLYAGGGTPSLLSPAQIRRLLQAVDGRFRFRKDAERSFECEPTTLTPAKLDALRSGGIDRLSIGVQSLHAPVLGSAARQRQTPEAALRAVRRAKAAGFPRGINADLMLGLARDTPSTFMESFRRLAAEGPEKITLYALLPTKAYLRRHHSGVPARFYGRYERFAVTVRAALEREARERGYRFSPESQCEWTLRRADRIEKPGRSHYEDSPRVPASTLAFGPTTRSYLAGTAFYRSLGKASDGFDPGRRDFRGTPMDGGDERLKSLLMGLRTFGWVDLAEHKALHRKALDAEFSAGIRELSRRGLARIDEGRLSLTDSGPRARLLACLCLAGPGRVRRVLDDILSHTSPPPVPAMRPGTRLPKNHRRFRVEFKDAYAVLEAEPARPGAEYLYADGALGLRERMWFRGGLEGAQASSGLRRVIGKACASGRVLREEGARTLEMIRKRLQRALRQAGQEARVRPEVSAGRASRKRELPAERASFPEDFQGDGCVPTYRQVMPEVLKRMLARERAKEGLSPRFTGIPPCMLGHAGRKLSPRLWEHLAKTYLRMGRDPAAAGDDHRVLGPRCGDCHFLGVCDGLPSAYAEVHGVFEVQPVLPISSAED